jgi:hypothetical protein
MSLGTLEDLLVVVFGCWAFASLCGLFQFRSLYPSNLFILFPRWPLFAPRPAMHQYHLLVRTASGRPSHRWREVTQRRNSSLVRWIWNPYSLELIAIFRISQLLGEFGDADVKVTAMRKRARAVLLDYVANSIREDPLSIQLLIMRVSPLTGASDVVFYHTTFS